LLSDNNKLTLLANQFNLSDKANVGCSAHWVIQQQATIANGDLVAQNNRATGTKAHLVIEPIQAKPNATRDD